MNKIFKISLTFVLIVAIVCALSSVFAATTDELVAYASKTFTIAGKSVKLSDVNIGKVKRYLAQYPVSEADADKIIAKVDEGVALMNAAGVSSPNQLSQAKKDELLKIAQDAAAIAGASISYDASNKVVTIYKNGEVWDTVDVSSNFKKTGSSNIVYVAFAGVAVIAIAAVAVRKFRVNA